MFLEYVVWFNMSVQNFPSKTGKMDKPWRKDEHV